MKNRRYDTGGGGRRNMFGIGAGASTPIGPGTPDRVTRWITANTIGDSIARDNGTNLAINTSILPATPYKMDVAGAMRARNSIDFGGVNVADAIGMITTNASTLQIKSLGAVGSGTIEIGRSNTTDVLILGDYGVTSSIVVERSADMQFNAEASAVFNSMSNGGGEVFRYNYPLLSFTRANAYTGVLQAAGLPYEGSNDPALPTTLAVDLFNVVRVKNTDGAHYYFDLVNPAPNQILYVLNESEHEVRIRIATGFTDDFQVVYPASFGRGITKLFWNAYLPYACWCSLNEEPHNEVYALTDAATILVPVKCGNLKYKVTLGGDRILGNPSYPLGDGQTLTFFITQDGTGGRLLTYGSDYSFGTDLPSPALSTGIGITDILQFVYQLSALKWRFVSLIRGFA